MSALPASLGAITLFVDGHERSKAFYADVFGIEPVYEDESSVVFKLDGTLLNLLDRTSADSLIGPAPVAAAGAGESLQLTIWVEDTDATAVELAKRGIELLNGPLDREWGMRTATFRDPDGYVWEIAADIPSDGEAA
jgi:catechol 2,3-dioxygenase-like lactoylglutathione lyase family enzyme